MTSFRLLYRLNSAMASASVWFRNCRMPERQLSCFFGLGQRLALHENTTAARSSDSARSQEGSRCAAFCGTGSLTRTLDADFPLGNDDLDVVIAIATDGEFRSDCDDAFVANANNERALGIVRDFEERLAVLQLDPAFSIGQGNSDLAVGIEGDL